MCYVTTGIGFHHNVDCLCQQKPNLILNVDGFIGVAMVDLLRNSDCFTRYFECLF